MFRLTRWLRQSRRYQRLLLWAVAAVVFGSITLWYRVDFDDYPPDYKAIREAERNLPQHNLDLPFPEGRYGRYVKFTCQIQQLGWNNVLNELCVQLGGDFEL